MIYKDKSPQSTVDGPRLDFCGLWTVDGGLILTTQRSLCVFLMFLIFSSPFILIAKEPSSSHRIPLRQDTDFLTFEELKSLSANPYPREVLKEKLRRFWRTPLISNEPYYRGVKPHRPIHPQLGTFLRLVSWNIEKSIHINRAINVFTVPKAYALMINPTKAGKGSMLYRKAMRQRSKLDVADIVVLQEMDIGVKRSQYRDAARELAHVLDMNYAYAPEYLEVDPVTLGLEKVKFEEGEIDQEATDFYAADPSRYKGVFGCAVLSRYPIKLAEAFPLKNQPYDWYWGERPKITFLEGARRFGSKTIFKSEITRELKVGGRIYFRVDLEVPDLPEKTLTIINVHLEIKCLPQGREAQMAEILSTIREINHPVILVGDFNSAPEDLSPTSAPRVIERSLKDPQTWLTAAVNVVFPNALVVNTGRFLSNITKNLQNPLARDVPVVAPNPVQRLFKMIEDFRFEDGRAFDFRGDRNRSIHGEEGALANSNEHDLKGFKTTFSVKRSIARVIGKYRLDWIFVKSYLGSPKDREGPYRFAPHFGETLEEMNTCLVVPISDHHPNAVDLPFQEPA